MKNPIPDIFGTPPTYAHMSDDDLAAEDARLDAGDVDVIHLVEQYIRRFLVLPDSAYLPLSLWAVGTYLYNEFDCFPYLGILSPTKRCGKTRVLEVLELLCYCAWRGTAPTSAVLYRMLEKCPSWLVDEVEALKGKQLSEGQQGVLGILNAGHRKGATVPRCEGPKHTVVFFKTYGPKALACIGTLPGTLADRSIIVNMQRKPKEQRLDRFLFARAKADADAIQSELRKWVAQCRKTVRIMYVDSPDLEFLSDRNADIWMSLFAVCAVACQERLGALRKAAVELSESKEKDDVDDTRNLKLLSDLRDIWPQGADNMSSADLIEKLRKLEESPWGEPGRELRAIGLAKMLKPFKVVIPQSVRVEGKDTTVKGYKRSNMEEAFSRYLPQK